MKCKSEVVPPAATQIMLPIRVQQFCHTWSTCPESGSQANQSKSKHAALTGGCQKTKCCSKTANASLEAPSSSSCPKKDCSSTANAPLQASSSGSCQKNKCCSKTVGAPPEGPSSSCSQQKSCSKTADVALQPPPSGMPSSSASEEMANYRAEVAFVSAQARLHNLQAAARKSTVAKRWMSIQGRPHQVCLVDKTCQKLLG